MCVKCQDEAQEDWPPKPTKKLRMQTRGVVSGLLKLKSWINDWCLQSMPIQEVTPSTIFEGEEFESWSPLSQPFRNVGPSQMTIVRGCRYVLAFINDQYEQRGKCSPSQKNRLGKESDALMYGGVCFSNEFLDFLEHEGLQ